MYCKAEVKVLPSNRVAQICSNPIYATLHHPFVFEPTEKDDSNNEWLLFSEALDKWFKFIFIRLKWYVLGNVCVKKHRMTIVDSN
jgi:hypothetical protein